MLILGGIISSSSADVNKPRVFSPSRTTMHNKNKGSLLYPDHFETLRTYARTQSFRPPDETIVAEITWNRSAGPDDIDNRRDRSWELMTNSDILFFLLDKILCFFI